jgi:membrane-associated phospholipid phosphatase
MWRDISDAMLQLAIRRLFAIYLAVAAVALLFPYHPPFWPVLLALHAIGVALMLSPSMLGGFQRRFPRVSRVLADWYLLILVPGLYTELAVLNKSIFNGYYFDALIMSVEQHIFGSQPSRDLAHALPYLPLSEYLHFAYISYYFIIYAPPIILYLRGDRHRHQQLVFNIMLAFFAHYVFFIYFPVEGPRYIFPAPGGNLANGFFYNMAHRVLEAGSSRGAAFPSSHVGVSFAQTAFAFKVMPRFAPVLLILATSLALGAVYGGFHYGTDAICGFAFGLLLFVMAPRVARLLGKQHP